MSEDEGIIPTSWPKWFGHRTASALVAAGTVAVWHYFGLWALVGLFVFQSFIGASLVYFKRRGEL